MFTSQYTTLVANLISFLVTFCCQVRNLRSVVCLLALKCLADMFQYLKKDMIGVSAAYFIIHVSYLRCSLL